MSEFHSDDHCIYYCGQESLRRNGVALIVNKGVWNAGDPGLIPGLWRYPGEGNGYPLQYSWASLVAQLVKNPPAMWETWVWSLGWEDPLEKETATHSSILAWRIPWTIPWGYKELDTTGWLSHQGTADSSGALRVCFCWRCFYPSFRTLTCSRGAQCCQRYTQVECCSSGVTCPRPEKN